MKKKTSFRYYSPHLSPQCSPTFRHTLHPRHTFHHQYILAKKSFIIVIRENLLVEVT